MVWKLETLCSNKYIRVCKECHEYCGDCANPVKLLSFGKINSRGPKRKHSEGLVHPGEVSPQDGEVDEEKEDNNRKQRKRNFEAVGDRALVEFEDVRDGQTRRSERGIACGNGEDTYADDCDNAADCAEESEGDGADNDSGGTCGRELEDAAREECHRDSGPDQCEETFHDHRAVEDIAPAFFVCHTARHERRLGGVEARDRAAGDGDEEVRPHRSAGRVWVAKGEFRDVSYRACCKEHNSHADAEQEHAGAEDGIQPCNQLIDRNDCRD